MADIRGASLAAHAAARAARENDPAGFAARAAGQAAATAHVPQHAFGAAYHALKAVIAAEAADAAARAAKGRSWQASHLPRRLRQEFLERVVVRDQGRRVLVNVLKDGDF
jgi:predicted fused transcriptional regulator/phosphomethylpyrimidine kinase